MAIISKEQAYRKIKKHHETNKQEMSPEQSKKKELEHQLKASRLNGRELKKRLQETEKQLKYAQDEVKRLKIDILNLKEDLEWARTNKNKK